MIVTITKVEQLTGDYGEYRKVTGIDGKGKEVTKNVSNRFEDKWDILRENRAVDFKMTQKDNKWYVADIKQLELPPSTEPEILSEHQDVIDRAIKPQEVSGQERGMWWKELGEMLRAGDIDKTKPEGKLLRTAYYAKMLEVLNLKIKQKEE